MTSKRILCGVLLLFLCLHAGRVTSAETRSFTVHFAGCTEFAGWGPVSLAEAQPLVPTGYVIAGAAVGQADNQALAEHFQIAGLPAVFDPQLTYEYTPDSIGTSGELYVSAAGQGVPAYFLFGAETDPLPNSQQSFLANWWFTGNGGKMKQSTVFPVISFGTAAVTLYTSNTSLLGNLIGGNTASNFSILSVRGVYPAATMTVTFKASGDK